jgi:hypothetical protein
VLASSARFGEEPVRKRLNCVAKTIVIAYGAVLISIVPASDGQFENAHDMCLTNSGPYNDSMNNKK